MNSGDYIIISLRPYGKEPCEFSIYDPDSVTVGRYVTRVKSGSGYTIYLNDNIISMRVEGKVTVVYES